MDQSKGAYNDQTVRVTALQCAIQTHAQCDGLPDGVIEEARDFYLFLSCKDPVIDGINGTYEEEEDVMDPEAAIHDLLDALDATFSEPGADLPVGSIISFREARRELDRKAMQQWEQND